VLFAGLQRHAQRLVAAAVDRDADDAAGDRTLVLVPGGEKGRVRTAETERDAEALRRAESDVGSHFPRRAQQDQRHQVRGDGDDAAARLDGGNRSAEVADFAEFVRILKQRAEDLLLRRLVRGAEDEFEAKEGGARPEHVDGLREAAGVDKEAVRFRLADPAGHAHRFGCGGRFVEQRGVGEFETGEVDRPSAGS
jgi:hypothetical protein